jgi:ribosomal protein L34E
LSRVKHDENHCWRCGRKFGTIIYAQSFPISIGEVSPDDDGSILCEECMEKELEEEMLEEEPT